MKWLIKMALGALWRLTRPVRRPILRKYESFLKRSLPPTPIERFVWIIDESNSVMDQVVRELIRLQRQTEYLQQTVENLSLERDFPTAGDTIRPGDQGSARKRRAG